MADGNAGQPKVKTTWAAAGGALLVVAIMDTLAPVGSALHLSSNEHGLEIAGAIIAFMAGVAGPLLRAFEGWVQETRPDEGRIAALERDHKELAAIVKTLLEGRSE